MYALAHGHCFSCGSLFGFNPLRVPSFTPPGGTREPICRACVDQANAERLTAGIEPHPIHDDAYEPIAEEELHRDG
tara:strand:+ start:104 stop:331 length:228 start_codon:yes stop_codon:yes gene_type:complete